MLTLNRKFMNIISRCTKRGIPIFLLFFLAAFLTGCSGGGNQITQMDDRYLSEQSGEGSKEDSSQEGKRDGASTEESDAPPSEPEEMGPGDSTDKENTSLKDKGKDGEQKKASAEKNAPDENKKSESNVLRETAAPKKSSKASSRVETPADKSKKDTSKTESSQGDERGKPKKDQNSITCYISIDCKNILSHISQLKESKKEFVPEDGVILKETKVTADKGTSVYDVLYQVCRDRRLHLEAAYTPMYKTYYVEGINQLYEFDCGSLSGWNYTVNGVQSNYGCSKYQVQDGDVIAWRYTCDRGKDV